MESQLPWHYVVCNLTMTVPTEQRSMHFSRTNITKFRRLFQISLTWFICVDQPSQFSASWEYILCCTSCEQQSQRSRHFAFWQKQTVAQDPYSCSLDFGSQATHSSPRPDCTILQLMNMFTCHTELPSQGLPFIHCTELQPHLAADGV